MMVKRVLIVSYSFKRLCHYNRHDVRLIDMNSRNTSRSYNMHRDMYFEWLICEQATRPTLLFSRGALVKALLFTSKFSSDDFKVTGFKYLAPCPPRYVGS